MIASGYGTEARSYNALGQLTNITVGASLNITYTYPSAGQNNGKIASQTDAVTGETMTYAYDSNDPINANDPDGLFESNSWWQTYQIWQRLILMWLPFPSPQPPRPAPLDSLAPTPLQIKQDLYKDYGEKIND